MATTMMMIVSRTRRGPPIVRLALPSCPPLTLASADIWAEPISGWVKEVWPLQKHSRRNRSA